MLIERIDEVEELDIKDVEFEGTEIISINGGKKIDDLQKKYPNIEIIHGKASKTDKPIKLNLLEMENDRREIIDAATETILGKRIDKLEKPVQFPFAGVMFVLGLMTGSAIWMYISKFVLGG